MSGQQRAAIGPNLRAMALPFAVILFATLATRLIWFGDALASTDEQLYALIGADLAQGHLPYAGLWDRKPIGLFAIIAAGYHLTGASPLGYQLIAVLFTLAGAGFTYLLARQLVDRVTACGAAALYPVMMALYGAHSGQSEAFHVPLMAAMAWLVFAPGDRRFAARAAAAMLIGGLALQVKYTVLPQCLLFGVAALWRQHGMGESPLQLAARALAYAALGLVPQALVALLFWTNGSFDAFWFANFASFFLRDGLGRMSPDLLAGALPLFVLAATGLYAHWRIRPVEDRGTYRLYALWFAAAALTVFLPGTVYLYYFAALVPPTILLALPLLDRRGRAGVLPLIAVGAAVLLLLAPWKDYREAQANRAALAGMTQAIAPLVADPQQCLWVHDGPAALYLAARSCLPTRYIYPDHLNNALEDGALGISQASEVRRILAAAPPVIVTADTPVTPQNRAVSALVEQAIAAHYRPLHTATIHTRTIRAWQRVR
ncbi:ArnT family glycosyltransferase [Qipengyuania marisflavi]|nr:glycosyltransferase family 39 protein [Qipengyuania marisflavi]